MPNRKYFERAMKKIIADANEKETYLFIFDVDHFKAINDTCGHKAGDAALIDTSKTVAALLKGKGMLFRWGGDEFCGVMMCSRPKDLLEALHQAVGELPEHLTISIGYTRISSEDMVSMILKRADHALYEAKESGRNQSCCSEKAS
jgi:diguanylate cyclase (GGDEF)-like protein